MKRRLGGFGLAVGIVLVHAGAVRAQTQVIGGHALDNNLLVGSGGLNVGNNSAWRNSAAIARPTYGAMNTNPRRGNPGMSTSLYWTGSAGGDSPSNVSMGYQTPRGGITYVPSGGGGPVYDALANPLYAAVQPGVLIERGSGGGGGYGYGGGGSQYLQANEAPALAAPRYRAIP